jgi:hypothetical protein
LNESKDQLTSYGNLYKILQDRRQLIVKQVHHNLINSIRKFTDEVDYSVKYDQYSYLLSENLIVNDVEMQ